jgi:hypothetical protein
MIPRMTVEDKRIELRYQIHESIQRIPKNKRWIVEAIVMYFLALTEIINLYKIIKGKISHE